VPDIKAVEQFRKLFRGRDNAHGQFTQLPGGDKSVKTVKSAPLPEIWENHLAGRGPFLGIIPLRSDGLCYFGAIDIDNHETKREVGFVALEKAVKDHRLPLVVCRSKSGGAHLYLFCKEPVPAKLMIERLKTWARTLKITLPYEIFPKQVRAEVGNWINLPYYGGDSTDRYAVIEGRKETLGVFLSHAILHSQTLNGLEGLADVDGGVDHPFKAGPPCLIRLHADGYPDGVRNNAMYNVAVYFKIRGDDDWKDQIAQYNQEKCSPPLNEYEINILVRSVEEHDDYKYRCGKDEDVGSSIIASVCNRELCQTRRFGIRYWHAADVDAAFPSMEGMVILKTDPPRYFINIDNVNVQMSPEEFLVYPKFKLQVMMACTMIPPSVKQVDWEVRANQLLASAKHLEAPPDAGLAGQFNVLVADFLSRARPGVHEPAELLRGNPFYFENRIHFRSRDLFTFLADQRFRGFTEAQVYAHLYSRGAKQRVWKLKGNAIRSWSVPIPREEFQSEPMDVPSSEREAARKF
jgi:hypothetical protein